MWIGKCLFFFIGFAATNVDGGTDAFIPPKPSLRESCALEGDTENNERAQRIMFNQQSRKREAMKYQIIAAEACEPLARRIEAVCLYMFQ